ncbi:MAG: hypothetical protein ACREP9_06605 [Candidatus Dormibacteraceae bacterium]
MKLLITGLILSCLATAADLKSLPNQAGNGNIDLAGTVFIDSKDIQQVLGTTLDPGYIVVRIKVEPRMLQAIRISSDDFTLVSRKDGERSDALLPSQIGGAPNLVLKSKTTYAGSSGVSSTSVNVAPASSKTAPPESPSTKLLESKMLQDVETKQPVEGLLYFLMQGKNKPKDLGLLYKGPAGHLAMDFK